MREGHVTLVTPRDRVHPAAVALLLVGFGGCVLTSVVLGLLGMMPDAYMQPVSALYVVPFLVTLTFLMRPAVGYLTLLWPILYGLHAILMVLGVPLRFPPPWTFLDILLPISGYGILTGLVNHAYNRFALHRLCSLARMGGDAGKDADEGEQS